MPMATALSGRMPAPYSDPSYTKTALSVYEPLSFGLPYTAEPVSVYGNEYCNFLTQNLFCFYVCF